MLTDQTIIAIRKGTSASTTEPFADSLAFARAVVEADRAQRMPDIAEIRRVLACVKSSVDSGIPVTDGWRILDALLASTPAPAQQEPAKPMDAHRAAYFMRRFLHEEKMLGPNEQAALHFTIAALEAMESAAQPQEPPQQERKPMTDREADILTEQHYYLGGRMPADYRISVVRATERHHGIKE